MKLGKCALTRGGSAIAAMLLFAVLACSAKADVKNVWIGVNGAT